LAVAAMRRASIVHGLDHTPEVETKSIEPVTV